MKKITFPITVQPPNGLLECVACQAVHNIIICKSYENLIYFKIDCFNYIGKAFYDTKDMLDRLNSLQIEMKEYFNSDKLAHVFKVF